jgi:peroxiredoxin Q/BCP
MRDDHEAFKKLGARIVVVTRHDPARMRAYWAEHKLPFIGVPDPDGAITERYGQQWKLFKLGRMPAQFVIDCQNKIAFSHYGSSMSDIPKNARMLEVIRGLSNCEGES